MDISNSFEYVNENSVITRITLATCCTFLVIYRHELLFRKENLGYATIKCDKSFG